MPQTPANAGTGITPVSKPTSTPPSSSAPAAQPSSPATSTGAPSGAHNVWNELVFAFIGTAALSVIANLNERLGRVLLAVMIGFLLMWLLLHSGQLAGWISKAVPQTRPVA